VTVLQGFIFGSSAYDPVTFVTVASLLVAVASVAAFIPALSVLRLDPATALREE
jgi:putative ABC transport system permease protein